MEDDAYTMARSQRENRPTSHSPPSGHIFNDLPSDQASPFRALYGEKILVPHCKAWEPLW